MFKKATKTYHEFPPKFWVLVMASFIDVLGGTLIFPFFSLYVTQKFGVGMAQAGALLAIFSITGLTGSMLGGALTDKFGRRGMVLFGLVFSALSSLSMGVVNQLPTFYLLAVVVGFLSRIGGPARQAMVADLLPEEQRAEGFSILRVALNISWVLGPSIGGFLAARSYLLLFVLDAITSLITALIVYKAIPETKPAAPEGKPQQGFLETLVGYKLVARDTLYMAFLFTSILMLIVYQQAYSTLSVYLRDVHGIPAQGYGLLMSLNAGTVVLLQFWVTRRFKNLAPMLTMAAGTAFYLVGFTMYGLVTTYPLFIVAMLIITIGEMIVVPVGQTLAARFAPEDMRGRYMAFFGLSWTIPSAIGPWVAGLVMDHYNPNWIWYAGGVISAVAIAGFLLLHVKTRPRLAIKSTEQKQALAVS
jgi:MFS family permease